MLSTRDTLTARLRAATSGASPELKRARTAESGPDYTTLAALMRVEPFADLSALVGERVVRELERREPDIWAHAVAATFPALTRLPPALEHYLERGRLGTRTAAYRLLFEHLLAVIDVPEFAYGFAIALGGGTASPPAPVRAGARLASDVVAARVITLPTPLFDQTHLHFVRRRTYFRVRVFVNWRRAEVLGLPIMQSLAYINESTTTFVRVRYTPRRLDDAMARRFTELLALPLPPVPERSLAEDAVFEFRVTQFMRRPRTDRVRGSATFGAFVRRVAGTLGWETGHVGASTMMLKVVFADERLPRSVNPTRLFLALIRPSVSRLPTPGAAPVPEDAVFTMRIDDVFDARVTRERTLDIDVRTLNSLSVR